MSDETIRTLAWAAVFIFAIHGATTYAIVRMFVTGRSVFERRTPNERRDDDVHDEFLGHRPRIVASDR